MLVPELPFNLDNIKGGVHAASINLIRGFSELDVYLRVLSFSREVEKEKVKIISRKIEIIYLPEGPFKYHSINYLFITPQKLKKQIRSFKPSLIHFEVGNTFMFSKILGLYNTKYLLTIHGMSFDEGKIKTKWKDKFTWFFNAIVQELMYPKNVIHLSNYSKNKFSKFKQIHSAIIPNAVNETYFNIPLKLNTENKLLYVGLIDTNKNLIFLLKKLKLLINQNYLFTLDVVGDFINKDYKITVLEFIKNNNLDDFIRFHGWVSQTALCSILAKTDILILSSMHESLPMVIAEAMSSGKVVVASDVGGVSEMIQNNYNGFLFSLNNDSEFIEIMKLLYNNSSVCRGIGINAKKYSLEKYHSKNVAVRTLQFYQKIIND